MLRLDDQGREYLDFTSGIAVSALATAIRSGSSGAAPAGELVHVSNLFRNPLQVSSPAAGLRAAGPRVFCNSARANER